MYILTNSGYILLLNKQFGNILELILFKAFLYGLFSTNKSGKILKLFHFFKELFVKIINLFLMLMFCKISLMSSNPKPSETIKTFLLLKSLVSNFGNLSVLFVSSLFINVFISSSWIKLLISIGNTWFIVKFLTSSSGSISLRFLYPRSFAFAFISSKNYKASACFSL